MLTDMQLTEQDIWPGRTALLKTGMLLPPLELTFNARTPERNSSHYSFPLMLAITIPLPDDLSKRRKDALSTLSLHIRIRDFLDTSSRLSQLPKRPLELALLLKAVYQLLNSRKKARVTKAGPMT